MQGTGGQTSVCRVSLHRDGTTPATNASAVPGQNIRFSSVMTSTRRWAWSRSLLGTLVGSEKLRQRNAFPLRFSLGVAERAGSRSQFTLCLQPVVNIVSVFAA